MSISGPRWKFTPFSFIFRGDDVRLRLHLWWAPQPLGLLRNARSLGAPNRPDAKNLRGDSLPEFHARFQNMIDFPGWFCRESITGFWFPGLESLFWEDHVGPSTQEVRN